MASPSVVSTATTNGTTATTTPVVNLPATISAGNTLIVLIQVAVTGAIGWPGGWTELFDTASGGSSDDQMAGAWRKADGAEGSTITLSSGNGKFAALAYNLSGATDPTVTPPEISTEAIGASTTPDPTTCTPTGGAKDYLWLWLGGWEGEQTSPPASTPTNYTDALGADSGTAGAATTNCRVASARRALNAASENPPSWTISVADQWTAFTLAVHPASGSTTPITLAVTGTLTPVVARQSTFARALSAASTFTPGFARVASFFRTLAVGSTFTAALIRQITVTLAVGSVFVPALAAQLVFLKALAAASTLIPGLSTQYLAGRVLAVGATMSAAMTKQVNKTLAVAAPLVVGIQRNIYIMLAVTSAFGVEMRRGFFLVMAVVGSFGVVLGATYTRLQSLAVSGATWTAVIVPEFIAGGGAQIKAWIMLLLGVGQK